MEPKNKTGYFRRRNRLIGSAIGAFLVACILGSFFWLLCKGLSIKDELEEANKAFPRIKEAVAKNDSADAQSAVGDFIAHSAAAKNASEDPLWRLASSIPLLGPNLSAASEVARSADDIGTLALEPLISLSASLTPDSLMPDSSGIDIDALRSSAPTLSSASYAIDKSVERLDNINTAALIDQIAGPISRARDELRNVSGTLRAAADAGKIVPGMLGASGPRNFLLIIQNNAEARASGGIPGALAVLSLTNGKLSLGAQSSAADLGIATPSLNVDQEQTQIYSTRLGKYMQDVNLTPDFPTAASTAKKMWEEKTGQNVDGVISIDPVVLSYILQATGPVKISGPELSAVREAGLPTELSGENVVPTLLSDVYGKIKQPQLQDTYFAGVAKEVFFALSEGKGEARGLVTGITQGAQEGRVLVWSADSSEQSVISKYSLSGSVSGPSVLPAQFGVYFNDGTGAKMDYYVKRKVQLIKECPRDGYEQTKVRITSTNTAAANAGTSLPAYVTGGGVYGVTPGTVQTNIIAYGPVQANVESASIDGQKTPFAPYLHANRPVSIVTQQLVPGESKTVEFLFGRIAQHTEPNVVVTPTVQSVKDVVLPTENASCDQGQ